MLSDLLWLSSLLLFAFYGFKYPHITFSGVVFVDILKPQSLSYGFLAGKPISLVFFLLFIFSIIINSKQLSVPNKKTPTFLILLFMGWITLATYNAQFQNLAWIKYDYAIKTILLSLFIPFVLNTRVKLETFVAILVVAISFYTMVAGMKTLVGGGGYGKQFFSLGSNAGMNESSTMAMVAVLNMPFVIYLTNHSLFKTEIPFIKITGRLLLFSSFVAVIGSYARTGLIGLFLWFAMAFKDSKAKFKYAFIVIIFLMIAIPFIPSEWSVRMNTLSNATEESSAYGRLIVWAWTIDYVKDRPLMGGGFFSYMANAGVLQDYVKSGMTVGSVATGKAFHNIFFEVLGELGYVGLLIYLWIIILTYYLNVRTAQRSEKLAWDAVLAQTTNQALLIYCVCGMFVGVAFYQWLYFFLGIATCLNHIQSTREKKKTLS